jgi:ribulose-5-phosphate 4-epimerase/fuculose-1-phosphate aldolase
MIAAPGELVRACRRVGAEVPCWTQGPGSNLSVKVRAEAGDLLWIKASGERLDAVGAGGGSRGLAALDRDAFVAREPCLRRTDDPEQAYAAELRRSTIAGPELGRPSMEAGLHALLPAPWVLHFHAVAAVLMAHEAARDARRFDAFWASVTPLRVAQVHQVGPGLELMGAVRERPAADVFLLHNHGVVLQGPDPSEALDAWAAIERRFLEAYGYRAIADRLGAPARTVAAGLGRPAPLRLYFPDSAVFLERLRGVLEPAGEAGGEPQWLLAPGAWDADRDAAELWLATVLLLEACPELGELSDPIARRIAALPLEQLRRASGPRA